MSLSALLDRANGGHPNPKLLSSWFDPFAIQEVISYVNCKLDLSTHWKIHDVFYVGKLKRYTTTYDRKDPTSNRRDDDDQLPHGARNRGNLVPLIASENGDDDILDNTLVSPIWNEKGDDDIPHDAGNRIVGAR
ncbi:hypothetical protein Ae201684P_015408 [Aphanomyces euteiches]|nr:hypothetical protein Ae201684P_015408 [Aphanomyces euteiches]KAH9140594.1 hypothetical protein AeRB84_015181 [Aphanomyces euteiches]